MIVLRLEISQAVVLRAETAVFSQHTVVLHLKLIERHQILAETADAIFDRTAGSGNRRDQAEEPRLEGTEGPVTENAERHDDDDQQNECRDLDFFHPGWSAWVLPVSLSLMGGIS